MSLSSSAASLVGRLHQRLRRTASRFAQRLMRGDAVARQHRRAVVEFQPVAQRQVPLALPSLLDDVAGDHLRLRLELRVDAVQRVEHHEPVVAGDVGGGPDRIEEVRSACGMNFSTLAACARAMLGAASASGAARVAFRMVRRRIFSSPWLVGFRGEETGIRASPE